MKKPLHMHLHVIGVVALLAALPPPSPAQATPGARPHAGNVGALKPAWSAGFDTGRGQEATPIVVDGVMYVSTAWSKVYALDAATHGAVQDRPHLPPHQD